MLLAFGRIDGIVADQLATTCMLSVADDIYIAPDAERIADMVAAFLEWFESADTPRDPVLRAGIAHLWFVQIHRFDDGDGSIGRAVMDMAFTRGDDQPRRCYSLSRQIAADLTAYYRTLANMGRGDLDITEWLLWFIQSVHRAVDTAMETMNIVLEKARFWEWADTLPLNDRQRRVLARFLDDFKGNITTDKYGKIASTSQETALRDVNALIALGVLVRAEFWAAEAVPTCWHQVDTNLPFGDLANTA